MDRQFDSLIQTLHHIAHNAPSGRVFKEISSLMGKPYSTLSSELNEALDTHKFGADQVELLIELTDSDEPILFLARRRGLACIRLPKPGRCGSRAELALLKTVEEFSDVVKVFNEALDDDGKVDARERRKLRKEGHEAVESILGFLETIDSEEQ